MTSTQRPPAAVDARELYRFFRSGEEETLALRGVSVGAAPGQIVAVQGPSGSGKSTLLNCLAGLDEPAGGVVRIAGERISHRPELERSRIRSRRIGILLQHRNLLPHLSVRANIALVQHAPRRHKPAKTPDELLAQVGLSARSAARPATLSGGELARAGLAVALANDPDVILADEPTGELDGTTELQVLQLLADHADHGTAIVVVTHSAPVARIADLVVTLVDGRVV
ncbi:ABC transporter ATP-binding protein [Microlunatus ginsengisoli]|uniref:ABC transporter ATP-binding protein n=1 Tax=Microlunatus ginsengisoli TaxID=363863 RepID=A0ABP7AK58_9ACTN